MYFLLANATNMPRSYHRETNDALTNIIKRLALLSQSMKEKKGAQLDVTIEPLSQEPHSYIKIEANRVQDISILPLRWVTGANIDPCITSPTSQIAAIDA